MAQQPPAAPPPQAPPPAASGGTGLQPNIASLLAYLFGWIGGLVFILIEKDNREVKFNAWQSIAIDVAFVALYIVIFILAIIIRPLGLLTIFLWLGYLVLRIFLMIRAYQGQITKLPVIGDFAAQQAGL